MASFASEVSISQGSEFFTRFGRFGGNMIKLRKLLTDDEFMERWVKQLDERTVPDTKGSRRDIEYLVQVGAVNPHLLDTYNRLEQLERLLSTIGAALPPNHYRINVTYASMPSMGELKKELGENSVSTIFDGRPFILGASCQDMGRTPGGKVFYLHDPGGEWVIEERIAWSASQRNAVAPNGYRPATHEETYEFSNARPELAGFVGLGSFVIGDRDGFRYFASIGISGGKRILEGCPDGCQPRRMWVLFVAR